MQVHWSGNGIHADEKSGKLSLVLSRMVDTDEISLHFHNGLVLTSLWCSVGLDIILHAFGVLDLQRFLRK